MTGQVQVAPVGPSCAKQTQLGPRPGSAECGVRSIEGSEWMNESAKQSQLSCRTDGVHGIPYAAAEGPPRETKPIWRQGAANCGLQDGCGR